MMKILIPLVIFSLFAAGCYYDSEEDLFPSLPGECDTTLVNYSVDIVPIISDNCLSCHSNLAAPTIGNNIKLEEYSDIVSIAESVLGTVKHEPGVSPMPKGGGKITDCQINKMEAWINQGKKDN